MPYIIVLSPVKVIFQIIFTAPGGGDLPLTSRRLQEKIVETDCYPLTG